VRNVEVNAVYSRSPSSAKEFSLLAEELGVGKPKVYNDLHSMLSDQNVNAVWLTAPNDVHLEYARAVAEEARQGKGNLVGVAVEKPLARNVREARQMIEAVKRAGLLHGYLENQVFMPSVVRGKEVVWGFGGQERGEAILGQGCGGTRQGPQQVVLDA